MKNISGVSCSLFDHCRFRDVDIDYGYFGFLIVGGFNGCCHWTYYLTLPFTFIAVTAFKLLLLLPPVLPFVLYLAYYNEQSEKLSHWYFIIRLWKTTRRRWNQNENHFQLSHQSFYTPYDWIQPIQKNIQITHSWVMFGKFSDLDTPNDDQLVLLLHFVRRLVSVRWERQLMETKQSRKSLMLMKCN